jgi:hypothetical protein
MQEQAKRGPLCAPLFATCDLCSSEPRDYELDIHTALRTSRVLRLASLPLHRVYFQRRDGRPVGGTPMECTVHGGQIPMRFLSTIDMSVEQGLPVMRNFPSRPRCRLILGVPARWRQMIAVDHLFSPVVVEPSLPGLKTGDDWMSRFLKVFCRVLVGRAVATSDVPTLRASAQMKPPFAGSKALFAAVTARLDSRIDSVFLGWHSSSFLWLIAGKSIGSALRATILQ